MPRDVVPDADDLLCEQCGYRLNGLPDDGDCPECGFPVAESTNASPRRPPIWEAGTDRGPARFQATALSVLLRPKQFFRYMTAHGDERRSARFGLLAILPAILFSTKAVIMHCVITHLLDGSPGAGTLTWLLPAVPIVVAACWAGTYVAVVKLTAIEARYWGMRLPTGVVRRAMHYDAVHASAASLLPWAVTLVYLCLFIADDGFGRRWSFTYLITLSAAVVVVAFYLFGKYVTAMRALRYANR